MAKLEDFDTTPEIHYKNGVATQVVTYCVYNSKDLARSEVTLKSGGEITEYHEDPEHGDWDEPLVVSRKRLEDLAKANPHCIPALHVLGKTKAQVEKILADRKITLVKHL